MQISIQNVQKREDPYQLFLDSFKNKETRRKYNNWLYQFLKVIPEDLFKEEGQAPMCQEVGTLARCFVGLAKKNPDLAKNIIAEFIKEEKKLVEKNTNTIFGIDFVKTEFELNGLRIDSVCFDKKLNAFVIIEYKREQNYSVIDQGATYRNLLLKNPAEFILLCNESYNKNLKRSDVNWDKTRIIFISPAFTLYQKEAYESTDLPIELWTLKQYSNKTMVFEQIQTEDKLKPRDHPSHGAYSEDNHLAKADDDIKSLYAQLKNKILSLFNNVTMDPKQNYIAFIHRVNFADVIVQKSSLKLTLNMKKGTLSDPKNLARDISNIGHFGNGDYEVPIKDNENMDYLMSLIGQSYEKN